MSDVIDQHKVDNHTETVLKRMIESLPPSSSRDPARAATKGLRGMTFVSNPYVDLSLLNRCSDLFKTDQEKLTEFFCRNPTPARVEDVNNEENIEVLPPATATAVASNPPPEFFAQLIETMKNIQAPQHPTKIVGESRDHEEKSISPSSKTECRS